VDSGNPSAAIEKALLAARESEGINKYIGRPPALASNFTLDHVWEQTLQLLLFSKYLALCGRSRRKCTP
jgi:hypothetical protein